MRIAYMSGSYVPDRGADSVHVMRMCEAFAALGHEVTLHARPGNERVTSDADFYGIRHPFKIEKHWRPQVRVIGALAYAGLVARHLARHPPDLIYAREIYGMRFAANLGIPFVFESHWDLRHLPQKWTEAGFLRSPSCRRLVFISEALQRIYLQAFPWFPRERMLVAHDAANPPATSPPARTTTTGRLQVGYVGGFVPGYGLDMIAALAERRPHQDFHIVGGREELLTDWKARTAGIRNLTWHGFVAPSELGAMYGRFDVVLAPFQAGTKHIRWISPMKLFEYMAHTKAIVCSDFPVMREILTHGEDALLVPPADLDAWCTAIDQLQDPQLRQRLADSGFRKLTTHHTWQQRAKQVLDGLA
jgi:glycosyltransferase involved in cell wall biosynthesis